MTVFKPISVHQQLFDDLVRLEGREIAERHYMPFRPIPIAGKQNHRSYDALDYVKDKFHEVMTNVQ